MIPGECRRSPHISASRSLQGGHNFNRILCTGFFTTTISQAVLRAQGSPTRDRKLWMNSPEEIPHIIRLLLGEVEYFSVYT